MPIVKKQFIMPVMRRPSKISYTSYTRQLQPYNHYRKTLDCDCSNGGEVVRIIKDNNCCPTVTKSGQSITSNTYYQTHAQYMRARCQTYDQRATIVSDGQGGYKSTCTLGCPTVYKPNNKPFQTQGAVSSGSRIARLKYNALSARGQYRPGMTNTRLQDGGTTCTFRRNGDKSRCD